VIEMIFWGLLLSLLLAQSPESELRTASSHPMKFQLSLPKGWNNEKTWPVVVVITDAARDFAGNLAVFIKARQGRPYILVAPHVVTSGGRNYRRADSYRYSDEDWKRVEADGDWRFDEEGVAAVIADVRRKFRGEERCYLTGWEAGGHTVWALTFRHPEWFAAVAPVSTNYQGRWVDDATFSRRPERSKLPVRVLFCERKADSEGWEFFMKQTKSAMDVAEAHQFRRPEMKEIPGKPHGPLAEEVLEYFDGVRAAAGR